MHENLDIINDNNIENISDLSIRTTTDSDDLSFHRGTDRANDADMENFQTIKPRRMVDLEQKQHINGAEELMRGYKNLRKQQHKELKALELRQGNEMNEHKQKLDREMEQGTVGFTKLYTKLLQKHQTEIDKLKKLLLHNERKYLKQMNSRNDNEMKEFRSGLQKEYKSNKETKRKELTQTLTPKKERELAITRLKTDSHREMSRREKAKLECLETELKTSIRIKQRKHLLITHHREACHLEENLIKKDKYLTEKHSMYANQHESTQKIEFDHIHILQKLKESHMKGLHRAELDNQENYSTNTLKEMHKQHHALRKNHPNILRKKEQSIKKMMKSVITTNDLQFKALLNQKLILTNNQSEQKELTKGMTEDQKSMTRKVEKSYYDSIEDMRAKEDSKLNKLIQNQDSELRLKLKTELNLLEAYQRKQTEHLHIQHKSEINQLEEKVSVRLALIEERKQLELDEFNRERSESNRQLHDKHNRELLEFDKASSKTGVDLKIIAEESQLTPGDTEFDQLSIQGSMLSLSASSPSLNTSSPTNFRSNYN